MNEVKTPKKPLIVYYAIAILVVLLINTLLVPMVSQARVKYVDYGTFIQMTEEDKISEVQVQDNQIIFVTKEDEANKNAVYSLQVLSRNQDPPRHQPRFLRSFNGY